MGQFPQHLKLRQNYTRRAQGKKAIYQTCAFGASLYLNLAALEYSARPFNVLTLHVWRKAQLTRAMRNHMQNEHVNIGSSESSIVNRPFYLFISILVDFVAVLFSA